MALAGCRPCGRSRALTSPVLANWRAQVGQVARKLWPTSLKSGQLTCTVTRTGPTGQAACTALATAGCFWRLLLAVATRTCRWGLLLGVAPARPPGPASAQLGARLSTVHRRRLLLPGPLPGAGRSPRAAGQARHQVDREESTTCCARRSKAGFSAARPGGAPHGPQIAPAAAQPSTRPGPARGPTGPQRPPDAPSGAPPGGPPDAPPDATTPPRPQPPHPPRSQGRRRARKFRHPFPGPVFLLWWWLAVAAGGIGGAARAAPHRPGRAGQRRRPGRRALPRPGLV